jgi:hypothetical protein
MRSSFSREFTKFMEQSRCKYWIRSSRSLTNVTQPSAGFQMHRLSSGNRAASPVMSAVAPKAEIDLEPWKLRYGSVGVLPCDNLTAHYPAFIKVARTELAAP